MSFVLTGTIVPVFPRPLRVTATRVDDPRKRARTTVGEDGEFRIDDEATNLFDGIEPGAPAAIVVRVICGEQVLTRTTTTVTSGRSTPHLRIPLPSTGAEEIGAWLGGRIVTEGGRPAAGLDVIVERVEIGSTSIVYEGKTDSDGRWTVRLASEGRPLDVVVRVLDRAATELASQVHTNVERELALDLTVSAHAVVGGAEFDRLRVRSAELLQGTLATSLSPEERHVLAARLDVDVGTVDALSLDARWVEQGAPAGAVFALTQDGSITPRTVLGWSTEEIADRLDDAVTRSMVPGWDAPGTEVATEVRTAAAAVAAESPSGRVRRKWLVDAGLASPVVDAVVRAQFLGSVDDDAWTTVASTHGDEAASNARLVVEFEAAGIDEARVARQLLDLHHTGRLDSARGLARLSVDDWTELLGSVSDDPDGEPETREDHALRIARAVERRYPTLVVAHHWSRIGGRPELAQLAQEHPQFDLGRDRIDDAVATGALRIEGEDANVIEEELRLVQRLHVLAPEGYRAQTVEVLHAAGYGSATQIMELGPHVFAQRVGTDLDAKVADAVYAAATEKAALTSALVLRHHPNLEGRFAPKVVARPVANLGTLFGSLDYCGCVHCRSILSPAAYLADLLAWLRRIPVAQQTMLDRMMADKRRGDIVDIELSCANTHRPLPYIDMVNERLEVRLGGDATPRQTTWEDDALRVHQEYVNDSVYVALRDDVVHPLTMPFDLFTTEVRAYLGTMGVRWVDLLEGLGVEPEAVAAERLELSPAQLRIVVGEHYASLEQIWGVDSLTELVSVTRLLAASELSYAELQELLGMPWWTTPPTALSDELGLRIDLLEPCSLEGATLGGVPVPSAWLWDRLHRMLRVARWSGWRVRDVDLAVRTVGGGSLDRMTITAMGTVTAVRDRLGPIDHDELLSWWGPMDTRQGADSGPALYARVWSPTQVPSKSSVWLGLDDTQRELRWADQDLMASVPALAAALRVPAATLRQLLETWDDAPEFLSVDGLSWVHRRVSLARALGIPLLDLPGWTTVVGRDPFGSPADTASFLERFDRMREAEVSLPVLGYALGYSGGHGLMLDGPTHLRWLENIVAAVNEVGSVGEGADATPADVLQARLVELLTEEGVAAVWAVVVDASSDLAAERLTAVLRQWLGQWIEPQTLAELIHPTVEHVEMIAGLADALLGPATSVRRRRAAVRALEDEVRLDPGAAELLAETIEAREGTPLLDALLDDALRESVVQHAAAIADGGVGIAALGVSEVSAALRLWHRGAHLLRSLRLPHDALAWVVEHGSSLGWLTPAAVPSEGTSIVAPRAPHGLVDFVVLLRRAPEGASSVLAWLDAARQLEPTASVQPPLAEMVATSMGWSTAEVQPVIDGSKLTIADVLDLSAIFRLHRTVSEIRTTLVDPVELLQWAVNGATAETARQVKGVATSRVHPERRAAELGPVRDTIREAQRDALVVRYLALHPGTGGAEQIHGDLLIDPAMSSCRLTSRIQQSIAAVQLYVQRVQLGLEAALSIPEDMVEQWTWMGNYRVWEANRKVLLWPENWLDPQLRSDRTQLFSEAMGGISGTQLDERVAEHTVQGYLHGLRDMARLDVGAIAWDEGNERLHVFGRQRTAPRGWYYRRHEDGRWSPWEPVGVQIDAEEALALEHRGQVLLVWATVNERSTARDAANNRAPQEIRLSWSFHDGGAWSEPRQTGGDESLTNAGYTLRFRDNNTYFSMEEPPIDDPEALSLEAVPVGSSLRIVPLLRSDTPSGVTRGYFTLGYFEMDPCVGRFAAIGATRDPDGARAWRTGTQVDGGVRAPKSTTARWQSFGQPRDIEPHQWLSVPLREDDGYADSPAVLTGLGGYDIIGPRRPLPNPWASPQWSEWEPGLHADQPFVLQAAEHSFVVWPTPPLRIGQVLNGASTAFRFELFEHPYVCRLLEQAAASGVSGMYRPRASGEAGKLRRQRLEQELNYSPHPGLVRAFPKLTFDFGDGAHAEHNWELFLHLPLALAAKLSAMGDYAAAKRWLEYVFDPLGQPAEAGGSDPAARFWMIKPLWEAARSPSIEDDLQLLNRTDLSDEEDERRRGLLQQIERWTKHPFEPHVIARLRPGAYQRQVVMRYLDTLIAWGDALFARGTAEAIDEAAQLYLLASQILGPRPQPLPEADVPSRTFAQLAESLDALSNIMVATENLVPSGGKDDGTRAPLDNLSPRASGAGGTEPVSSGAVDGLVGSVASKPAAWVAPLSGVLLAQLVDHEQVRTPYFCVPANETLLGYWDKVHDRLFKIRHCLDLDGGRRVPELFAPPIDPGLLVEAVARGIDLSQALDDLFAPIPHYRFAAASARARELTSFVRDLGRTLLSVMERRDVEALALMYNEQERFTLEAVEQVRRSQIEDATRQLTSIDRARALAEHRYDYYRGLEQAGIHTLEERQLDEFGRASLDERKAENRRFAAGIVSSVPSLGFGWSFRSDTGWVKEAHALYGTAQISAAIHAAAERFSSKARRHERAANRSAFDAQYERRAERWSFEKDQAQREQERIDADRLVTEARIQVASHELEVHRRQVTNAKQTRAVLERKHTRQELYDWMLDATMETYRQAYTLAVDLARKAERAYRYELADDTARFVGGAHWESHRQGLLAGDRLALELERMETAHLEADRREHELVKRVSLATIDPGALLQLRFSGACEFELPEELFALDHPRHYLRRLRSVNLTVPVTAGSFVGTNATVTLSRSAVRPEPTGWDTEPVVDFTAGTESIALSTGNADAGGFEVGPDARRRPFEGKGAISRWRIEFPQLRQFDYRQLDDIIVELRYTARDGGQGYAETAIVPGLLERLGQRTLTVGTGWARSWGVAHAFPAAWQQFVDGQPLVLALRDSDYATVPVGLPRRLRRVHVIVEGLDAPDASVAVAMVAQGQPGSAGASEPVVAEMALVTSSALPGTHAGSVSLEADAVGTLTITDLDSTATDVVVLVEYEVGP